MADRVSPSGIRDAVPRLVAASMKHGSGDWIVTAGTDLYASYDGLAGPLQAFDVASSSTSSFDVTIDTGEGFVGGAYLARDSQTTVTLASQVTNQTVYVGWRHAATNMVIIGLDADFQADDPRIPIFDFDTDGSGVVSTTDRRPVGERIDTRNEGSAANADQAANANNLGNKDPTQYMRSDVEDTHEEPVEFGAGGGLSGTLGAGAGELLRAGGGTSDSLLQTQGGFGRVAWSWNTRYDDTNNEWVYIVGSEPAMAVLLNGGQVQFLTAGGGTAGDAIAFDTAIVEGGSIDRAAQADQAAEADRAADADEIGGNVSPAQLRANLSGNGNQITGLSDLRSDLIASETGSGVGWRLRGNSNVAVARLTPIYNGSQNTGASIDYDGSEYLLGARIDMGGSDLRNIGSGSATNFDIGGSPVMTADGSQQMTGPLRMADSPIRGVETLTMGPDAHQTIEIDVNQGTWSLQEVDTGVNMLRIPNATQALFQAANNPTANNALWSVLSEGGSERLRVEHKGRVTTTNNAFKTGRGKTTDGIGYFLGENGTRLVRTPNGGIKAYDDDGNGNLLIG